ncbi:MAG TPA: hypothetical protein VEU52_04615 [Candidatus Limnocylindrales bacterium]|nr:hypothetical protein [Candidatus Limnocylindrales bacterium]
MRSREARFAFLAALLPCAALLSASPDQRVRFIPKFVPGETLRYDIETQIITKGKATTPIENPEAASILKQSASVIVRLEVLNSTPSAPDSTARSGALRLRVTYEKSTATAESDAYDPAAGAIENQYALLEGRSVEFTLDAAGNLADVKGLDEVLANPSAAQTVRSWISQLSSSAKIPREGVAVGQKWTTEQPLAGTPLGGMLSRSTSTYLHNEQCPPGGGPLSPGAGNADAGLCAAILTHFEILRHGSKSDATPEEYRRHGLRTSGAWTGSGETLDLVSLAAGVLVRSTQTTTQDMDFQIASAATTSRMTYQGHVTSQTEITLLPAHPPQEEGAQGGAPRTPGAP